MHDRVVVEAPQVCGRRLCGHVALLVAVHPRVLNAYARVEEWVAPLFETDTLCQSCYVLPGCQGAACPVTRITEGHRTCCSVKSNLKREMRFNLDALATARAQAVAARAAAPPVVQEHIDWALSGLPFLTEPGALLDAVSSSIRDVTGRETKASTSGGTSDGRFIATMGTQVVELGPVNATIHQVNERVLAADLDVLTEIYYKTLIKLLA